MTRVKIRLDTLKDINRFAQIAMTVQDELVVTNNTGSYKVNAKSILGLMYAIEWNDIYMVASSINYMKFRDFIIEEDIVEDN